PVSPDEGIARLPAARIRIRSVSAGATPENLEAGRAPTAPPGRPDAPRAAGAPGSSGLVDTQGHGLLRVTCPTHGADGHGLRPERPASLAGRARWRRAGQLHRDKPAREA